LTPYPLSAKRSAWRGATAQHPPLNFGNVNFQAGNMAKDKEVVVDEVWTEERVRQFLDVKPVEDIEADFHMLLKSYQQMRVEDFAKFLDMFLAQGRQINARDPNGRTVLSYVREHRRSAEYAQILQQHGAE
jgi:hypothetical protein